MVEEEQKPIEEQGSDRGLSLAAELEVISEQKTEGELIGSGVQYLVYELPDGRVRKVLSTVDQTTEKLASWHEPGSIDVDELRGQANSLAVMTHDNESFIKGIIENNPKMSGYLANPEFRPEGGYDQDKATPLSDVLADVSADEAKKIFENYAKGFALEWEHGFCEISFNPTVNSGVDRNGNIVLFDFGEISRDPEEIKKFIESKRWLNQFSYTRGLPEKHKQIFADAMNEHVNIDKFIESWRSN